MKISVIIPVYNVEKYIRQCLESVINQTYKNLEIIIVNDGTKDNSMKIVEEYLQDKRIKIINKENGGLSSARNKGLEEATGKYISFIDSDDYIDLNLYENIVNELNEEDVIIFDYYVYNEKNKNFEIIAKKEENLKIDDNKFLCTSHSNNCWNKLYKREFILKIGIKFLEILYEDVFWNIQTIFEASKIKYINRKYYYYRINRENSIMTKSNKIEKDKSDNKFLEYQKYSYFKIYEAIHKFYLLNENKLILNNKLYLLIEEKKWESFIKNEIYLEELEKILKECYFKNLLLEEEKNIIKEKMNIILRNRNLDIKDINYFDWFYWKNGIMNIKILRRKGVKKLKNIFKIN